MKMERKDTKLKVIQPIENVNKMHNETPTKSTVNKAFNKKNCTGKHKICKMSSQCGQDGSAGNQKGYAISRTL